LSDIFKLNLRLTLGRQRLAEMVEKYGPLDPRVLKCSQELDKLVNELMRERMAG
jgi:hypothetical protein